MRILLLLNFFSTIFLLNSKEKIKVDKTFDFFNSYYYYERSIELIGEASKYKHKNRDRFEAKMEEALDFLKEGNRKMVYIPPEGSVIGMRNEEYESKCRKSREICRISLNLIKVMEMGKYLVKKYRDCEESEYKRAIEDYSAYLKFLERIMFSPKPPPYFVRLFFLGGMYYVLDEGVKPLLMKLKKKDDLKVLEQYEKILIEYNEKWIEQLKKVGNHINKKE